MSQCNVGFHFGFESADAGKSARAKYHPGDESRPEYFTVHIGADISIFITPEKLANLHRTIEAALVARAEQVKSDAEASAAKPAAPSNTGTDAVEDQPTAAEVIQSTMKQDSGDTAKAIVAQAVKSMREQVESYLAGLGWKSDDSGMVDKWFDYHLEFEDDGLWILQRFSDSDDPDTGIATARWKRIDEGETLEELKLAMEALRKPKNKDAVVHPPDAKIPW